MWFWADFYVDFAFCFVCVYVCVFVFLSGISSSRCHWAIIINAQGYNLHFLQTLNARVREWSSQHRNIGVTFNGVVMSGVFCIMYACLVSFGAAAALQMRLSQIVFERSRRLRRYISMHVLARVPVYVDVSMSPLYGRNTRMLWLFGFVAQKKN